MFRGTVRCVSRSWLWSFWIIAGCILLNAGAIQGGEHEKHWSLDPSSGPNTGGTLITIRGNRMPGTASVSIDGTDARVVSASGTKITLLSPPHARGQVEVALHFPGSRPPLPAGRFAYFDSTLSPLRVSTENPRYVTDASGKIIYLVGAYSTRVLCDNSRSAEPFDFGGFLDFYSRHGFNLIRGWSVEAYLDIHVPNQGTVGLERYALSSTCCGGYKPKRNKWDLREVNPLYLDRLRDRAIAAGNRGIYMSVQFFQGWDVSVHSCPVANSWDSHPFKAENNINGINGDPDNTGLGEATQQYFENEPEELQRVLAYQKEWVRTVIDYLNDLDNIFWEVANETQAKPGADRWQELMVHYIRQVESAKPKQHLIWRSTEIAGCNQTIKGPDGSDATLFASAADIVSPTYNGGDDYSATSTGPAASDGKKVVILDGDHVDMGDANHVWKAFMRGHNPLYANDALPNCDARCAPVVEALADTKRYADRIPLANMKPHPELTSTGFALADPGKDYLVYSPRSGPFYVNLSAFEGGFSVEWFDPTRHKKTLGRVIHGGSASRRFEPPFPGPSALDLDRSEESASFVTPLNLLCRPRWRLAGVLASLAVLAGLAVLTFFGIRNASSGSLDLS
jgi:hypothetical protein